MKKGEKLELLIKEVYPYLSINKFADNVGIKRTTMHEITKKEELDKVSVQNMLLISAALNMSLEELIFRLENDITSKERINYYLPNDENNYSVREEQSKYDIFQNESDNQSFSSLNYFGCVSAGKVESVEGMKSAEQIKLPKIFLGKHQNRDDIFVMKVNGESMNKILPSDSLIICAPVMNIDEIQNNDIVIFSYNNETSVKRFRTTGDNMIFSPESTCNDFFDVVVNKDTLAEVKIVAKVISYHVCLN